MMRLSEAEFKTKYDKYYILLSRISYSYLRNTSDVEDVIQEVFIKFYVLNKKFKDENHEKNWLIKSTINKSIDYLRKKKYVVNDDSIYLINEDKKQYEGAHDINYLVSKLDEKYRKVIVLFYYNNLSISEISSVLGISESNVKIRLKRAKSMLKEMEESSV